MLTRDKFKIHNEWNLTWKFEDLCVKYFFITNNQDLNKYNADPNHPGIEFYPINKWTLWLQAKFIESSGDVNSLNKELKKSFAKLKNYPELKKVLVISNLNFKINWSKLEKNIKNIKIEYLNGPSFLKHLESWKYFDLQYQYFWKNNWGGFFVAQQIKYKDITEWWIDKRCISIYKEWNKSKISLQSFFNGIVKNDEWGIILLEGKPATGKSLIFTYFIKELANNFQNHQDFLPISIRLISLRGSLLDYINNELKTYIDSNIQAFQKIVLFLDGWNEISSSKCEELSQELQSFLRANTNIDKIIISTRTGSIKNIFLDTLTIKKYRLESTYHFNIEDYISQCIKNIDINFKEVLIPRISNLYNFLWKIAINYNFYEEDSPLSINAFQELIKKELWILNNESINNLSEKLVDANIIIINEWTNNIYFSDQKIYEYFFIQYIIKHFINLLPQLRKYNFFYKENIIEGIKEKINTETHSLSELIIKSLFLFRLENSSLDQSGRGLRAGPEVLIESLLNLNRHNIYLNDNNSILKFIRKYYLTPKTIKTLDERWETKLSNELYNEYIDIQNTKINEWRNFYTQHQNEDSLLQEKREELDMENIYNDEYLLIEKKLRINWKQKSDSVKKSINPKLKDPNRRNNFAILLVNTLEKDIKKFNKYINCLSKNNRKKTLLRFIVELTKIENIHLLNNLPNKTYQTILKYYSFTQAFNIVNNEQTNSNDRNEALSWLLISLLNSNPTETQRRQLTYISPPEKIIYNLKSNWRISYQKLLLIYSIVNTCDIRDVNDISNINNLIYFLSTTLNKYIKIGMNDKDPIIFLNEFLGWIYKYYMNILSFDNYDYYYHNLMYEWIFENIFTGLIKQNKLPRNFFTKLSIEISNKIPFITLLKKVIISNYKIDYTAAIKANILHRMQSSISYSDNSEIYSILSYFAAEKGDYNEWIKYFDLSLNNSFIRYGWRKDYFLEEIISIISLWYERGVLNEELAFRYYIEIWKMYDFLKEDCDGKWIRQIPASLHIATAKISTEKQKELDENFPNWIALHYYLDWQLGSFLERAERYENPYSLLRDIWNFNNIYPYSYNWTNPVSIIKIVIYLRLLNIPYYEIEKTNILSKLNNEIRYLPLRNFQELKIELSNFNWSGMNIKRFIQDFQSIQNEVERPLEGNINELMWDQYTSSRGLPPISIMNNAEESVLEKILNAWEILNNYDIKDEPILDAFLDKIQEIYPENYMEKILSSRLFYYWVWTNFSFYWEKFWSMFGKKIYQLNPVKFKQIIKNSIQFGSNPSDSYYFCNFDLIAEILIEEKDITSFQLLAKWLVDLWKLLVF